MYITVPLCLCLKALGECRSLYQVSLSLPNASRTSGTLNVTGSLTSRLQQPGRIGGPRNIFCSGLLLLSLNFAVDLRLRFVLSQHVSWPAYTELSCSLGLSLRRAWCDVTLWVPGVTLRLRPLRPPDRLGLCLCSTRAAGWALSMYSVSRLLCKPYNPSSGNSDTLLYNTTLEDAVLTPRQELCRKTTVYTVYSPVPPVADVASHLTAVISACCTSLGIAKKMPTHTARLRCCFEGAVNGLIENHPEPVALHHNKLL